MRRISYALSLMIAVAIAFTSCSKEGSAGADGATGPAGPAGPQGDAGAANVIYSEWLDVPFDYNSDTSAFIALIEAPQLSADILNSGEIKVYINLNTPAEPVITALPYIDAELVITAAFAEQTIALNSNGDVSTFTSDEGDKLLQYRYLIIPGGTAALKKPQIDLNDYNKVKEYYNLKD